MKADYKHYKRLFLVIIAVFLLIGALQITTQAASGESTVYITSTGECYHRSGCSYLKSKIEVTLSYAVSNGYRACSRCNPPTLTDSSETDNRAYRSSGKSQSESSEVTRSGSLNRSASAEVASSKDRGSTGWIVPSIIIGIPALVTLFVVFTSRGKRKKISASIPSVAPDQSAPSTATMKPKSSSLKHEWIIKSLSTSDSTCFKEMRYNPSLSILMLTFRDGGIYAYFNVPSSLWAQVQIAPSKGSFFKHSIEGKFPSSRIN